MLPTGGATSTQVSHWSSGIVEKRIHAEAAVLQNLSGTTRLSTGNSALPQHITEQLSGYQHVKPDIPLTAPTRSAIAASDTIEAAIERHTSYRILRQNINAESEELNWLAAVISDDRKQQSRSRNEYLLLDKSSHKRTATRLALML